jgi:hypothetical protein
VERTAKVMYGAVYYFGPRWGIGSGTRGPGGEKGSSIDDQTRFVTGLDDWVAAQDPSIEEIERKLESGVEFEKGAR